MNLGAFNISENNWVDINSLGITLEQDQTYIFQSPGTFLICNKDTQPQNNEGFVVSHCGNCSYTHTEGTIYLKAQTNGGVIVNIAK